MRLAKKGGGIADLIFTEALIDAMAGSAVYFSYMYDLRVAVVVDMH